MNSQPSVTCLLLFLGGRIQPAATTLFQLRPSLVGLIASEDTPYRIAQMQNLIASSLPNARILTPKLVPAYKPPATRLALAELLEEASILAPIFTPMISLTGAPMPMSVAAYEVARHLGCPAYYLNSEAGQLLDLAAEAVTTVDLRLKVEDYLNVYGVGLRGKADFIGDAHKLPYANALPALAASPRVTAELVTWMQSISQLAPPQLRSLSWTLRDAHWQLLCDLVQFGVVRELDHQGNGKDKIVTFGVTSSVAARFLEGGWLESYVYSQAQVATYEGTPLFDSCLGGVKLLNEGAEREIDFIGTHRSKALVATCKSGRNPWDKAALDEVVAVAKLFGDDYCLKLFITNQSVPSVKDNHSSAYTHFRAQAKQAQVAVVTGEELSELAAIFSKEIMNPTFGRN